MKRTRKKKLKTPPPKKRPCAIKGCTEHAEFPAPINRANPWRAASNKEPRADYIHLCLKHIKEYNKKWDFFSGMSDEEIIRFQNEAVTSHRPTKNWQLGPGHTLWDWTERLERFTRSFDGNEESANQRAKTKPKNDIPNHLRQALEALDVSLPLSLHALKKRYKTLVKRYHPDVNKGDKEAEERFKDINAAYHLLKQSDFISG